MAKGVAFLLVTLGGLNLAVMAIAFAFKYNRFPSGIGELLKWVLN